MLVMLDMATVMKDEKIIGGIGIAAAAVFLVAMFIASITSEDFSFGTGKLSDLFPEEVFVIGCLVSGILGAVFGLLITYKKAEAKLFIGKVRGVLMILSGAALAVIGFTEGDIWVVYLFTVLIILSAASDMFCNWIADQKIIMAFTLILMLMIALTGILCHTSDNNLLGFVFVLFICVWVILAAAMRFAPIEEAAPDIPKKKEKKNKSKEGEAKKKNAPAPRPYPVKKEEPPIQKKAPTEKTVYKEKPRKVELPKKEEAPVQKKEPPKKEEPKKEPPKKEEPEVKKELPKLKIMSSREAAAARETARKKEEPAAEPAAEPVKEEPVPEPVQAVESAAEPAAVPEEPVPEPVKEEIVPEAVTEPEQADSDAEEEAEEYDEALELAEDTPDALLRRATWNKGLRCRRDYGECRIPIAYVKAKVAVYVEDGAGDASADEKLRADGWTVLRYKVSDISDGKVQAEEINKAVKENLKAERAAKKKKSSKK